MIHLALTETPVGPVTLAARERRLCLLHFGAREEAVRQLLTRWYPGEPIEAAADPAGVVTALKAYFAGRLDAIDTIEVEMHGTPFQQRVWAALRSIKAGQTASYADIARTIDAQGAVRAVGAANGANPVAIVVPCHRIIGSNGTLTGYGGGLENKGWLLRHEGCRLF